MCERTVCPPAFALEDFGTALEPWKSSKCRIFTSQQTTFRLFLLIWRSNMDGLMKGKHAQKNFSTVGAMAPTTLSLKTWGGGGSRIQGPPPPCRLAHFISYLVFKNGYFQPGFMVNFEVKMSRFSTKFKRAIRAHVRPSRKS